MIAQRNVPAEVVSSRLVTSRDVAGGSVVVVVVGAGSVVVVGGRVGAVSLFASTPPNV